MGTHARKQPTKVEGISSQEGSHRSVVSVVRRLLHRVGTFGMPFTSRLLKRQPFLAQIR